MREKYCVLWNMEAVREGLMQFRYARLITFSLSR